LLGVWLLGTVLARPLATGIAAVAVRVEFRLGLDKSLGDGKE